MTGKDLWKRYRIVFTLALATLFYFFFLKVYILNSANSQPTEDAYGYLARSEKLSNGEYFNVGEKETRLSILSNNQGYPLILSILSGVIKLDYERSAGMLSLISMFLVVLLFLKFSLNLNSKIISSIFILSIIFVILNIKIAYITSFASPESIVLLFSSLVILVFLRNLSYKEALLIPMMSFVLLVHNFGYLLFFVTCIIYSYYEFNHKPWKIFYFIVASLAPVIITLIYVSITSGVYPGVLKSYTDTVSYSISNSFKISKGPDFITNISQFYFLKDISPILGAFALFVLTLFIFVYRKDLERRGSLPLLSLIFLIISFMILPPAASHITRYPLFLAPFLVFAVYSFFGAVYKLIIGKRVYILAVSILIIVYFLCVSTPDIVNMKNNWARWADEDYGSRIKMGDYIQNNLNYSSFFYHYWPSVIYSTRIQDSQLNDYVRVIISGDNPIDFLVDNNISYLIEDRAGNDYYNFFEKVKNLLDERIIFLEPTKRFSEKLLLSKIHLINHTRINVRLTDIDEDRIQGFSEEKLFRYHEPILNLNIGEEYLSLEGDGQIDLSEILPENYTDFIIYLKVRSNTESMGANGNKINLYPPPYWGWYWYKIELKNESKLFFNYSPTEKSYLDISRLSIYPLK